MRKKLKIAVFAAFLLLILGSTFAGYRYWQWLGEDRILSSNPNTKDAYAIIKKREIQLKTDSKNYDALMSLSFNWKGIGEITKNDKYLWRAIDAYDLVVKYYGNKAYLPFLNRANVYIDLKDYKKAAEDVLLASDIDPGEQSLYIVLVDIYKAMGRSDKEIRAVYERGIKTVVDGINLINSYAAYLYGAGDYKLALEYYKKLEQALPSNPAYPPIVKELEDKLK
jgi:tetratricopeptide (TPR) repeat protein